MAECVDARTEVRERLIEDDQRFLRRAFLASRVGKSMLLSRQELFKSSCYLPLDSTNPSPEFQESKRIMAFNRRRPPQTSRPSVPPTT